jgi:tetratricopeptide (TPR) repeat protein/predicted Ser/Thr protein kinase
VNAALYRRAREVFVRAIELDPANRAQLLDAECATDPDLRAELESLLAAHAAGSGFESVESVSMPERIGGYRVLDVLGEGGMGVVYLAEQDNPRRRVALKVLHAGIAAPSRIQRFRHEAQILGRLHHPGIAQVYEAGAEDTGAGPQPYLAMELVPGRTIVDHAVAERLALRERLQLLVQVCRAAHHAHERGVVHRDIKPANILVDEHGTPKILDFGIAHVTAEDPASRTLVTKAGEILGTLPFMSPEQLGADPSTVDPRADVYALGVVGYELLSGRLPIDLSGKSLPEAARAVREEEPVLLGRISRHLRGDLETIFARALEKDRERRYQSAKELADDIDRFLQVEPIVARPPSTIYQIAKFARRNGILVGGVAAVFLALLLGIAGTTWQAHRATIQRNEAQSAARRAEAALAFIDELFGSLDPDKTGRDARVLDVLRDGEIRLESSFADDPGVRASLRQTIGNAYKGLGMWPESEANLRRSLEHFREANAPDDHNLANARSNLATVLVREEKIAEAEALLDQAEAAYGKALATDPRDRIALRLARVGISMRRGQDNTAADELEQLLADARRTFGDENDVTLSVISNLAQVRLAQTQLDRAYELLEEGLAISRSMYGDEHSHTLVFAHNLATLLEDRQCFAEARQLLEQVLDVQKRRFGLDHEDTLATMNGLANVLEDLGEVDRAAEIYEQMLPQLRQRSGSADMKTITVANNLAVLWWHARGRPDRGEEIYRDLIEDIRRSGATETPDTVQLSYSLATLLHRTGRSFEADALYREVLQRARAVLPPESWWLGRYAAQYGQFLSEEGCHDDALPLLEVAWSCFRDTFGPTERRTVLVLKRLIGTCEALGREDRARELRASLPEPR